MLWRRTDLRHSSRRDAMPWRLIMLTTQMRLMPQMAGSAVVEQHQALWRSNITFSPSEPSGVGSSITLYPCEQSEGSVYWCSFVFLHSQHTFPFAVSYLLYVLCYKASTHFLVVGDEEEGLGLGGTLGLHLLEAEVTVHHLPDLLNLRDKQLMSNGGVCLLRAKDLFIYFHCWFICRSYFPITVLV